jgi:hypothetical protein
MEILYLENSVLSTDFSIMIKMKTGGELADFHPNNQYFSATGAIPEVDWGMSDLLIT